MCLSSMTSANNFPSLPAPPLTTDLWWYDRAVSHQGHVDVVTFLLAHHADVNVARRDGCTALMLAARFGRSAVVTQLLAHGARGTRDQRIAICLVNIVYVRV